MEHAYLYQFWTALIIGFLVSVAYFQNNEMQESGFRNFVNLLWKTEGVERQVKDVLCAESRLQNILRSQNRLLCFVTSAPRLKHQRAILDTWAQRCDTTIFIMGRKKTVTQKPAVTQNFSDPATTLTPKISTRMSSKSKLKGRCIKFETEYLMPTIKMVYFDMVDVYANLWQKTKLAFQYVVDEEQFDWVLKVDDDSYVLIDNLRLFLNDKDPDDPVYFGFHYKPNSPKGFNSGGPGYVMSRQNAEKFVHLLRGVITVNGSTCPKDLDAGPEDVYIANCLYGLGIYPNETRDEEGRYRFMPLNIQAAINSIGIPGWFWGLLLHPFKPGLECCSDSATSFHYTTPEWMRIMEYLVYYLHPFSSRSTWRKQSPEQTKLFDAYFNLTNDIDFLNLTRTQGCVRLRL